MTQDIKELVLNEYKNGNIVVAGIEGLQTMPIKDFIKQDAEFMLYDLNRSEAVVLTFIDDPKWVNDYAVGKVIRELKQQLSAERERYDQLKAKYDALVMDNATLEYNAAEAEKHLPDVIKQFVDQERERAAKLVGALKSTILIFNKLGYPKTAEFVKQTIAEYDTQTKS